MMEEETVSETWKFIADWPRRLHCRTFNW